MTPIDITQTAAMAERIRARLQELDITPNAAGKQSGRSRDLVRNLLRAADAGKAYNPRGDSLQLVAKLLGVRLQWLLTGEGERLARPEGELLPTYVSLGQPGGKPVLKAGRIGAGSFRPADLDPDEDLALSIAPDPRFPLAQQYAWEVVGDSMDKAGIEPGMTILGVDFHDYERHYGGARDGSFVVVQRLVDGGAERELTVKELRLYRDRTELVPHSRNEEHKTITLPRDFETETNKVALVAVVIDARRIFA